MNALPGLKARAPDGTHPAARRPPQGIDPALVKGIRKDKKWRRIGRAAILPDRGERKRHEQTRAPSYTIAHDEQGCFKTALNRLSWKGFQSGAMQSLDALMP
jgi:hypothetical protein